MTMRQVEIQARSVDEAVRLALEQLGRTREQVDVQVVSGAETGSDDDEVLVRVTAREQLSGNRARTPMREAQPPPAEIEEEDSLDRPPPGNSRFEPDRPPAPRGNERYPAPPPGNSRFDRSRAPGGPPSRRPLAPPSRGNERFDRPQRGGNQRFDRFERDRPSRGNERFDRPYTGSEPLPPGEITIDAALEPMRENDERSFDTPADAVAPVAAEILQKLLVGMRFHGGITRHDPQAEAEVNSGDTDPSVVLNITGLSADDQELLTGRRGENLTALQFMVNLLLGAQTDLWARIVVDVDGYRIKRRAALNMIAERAAERVIEQGTPYPLEPMSPYDRRLVHIALSEHPQVMTESTGEGEERRVVVMLREEANGQ